MSKKKPIVKLKVGDKVKIVGKKHPHKGSYGTLMSWGPYGPQVFGWIGWRVLSNERFGGEFYAKPEDVKAASNE